MGPGRAPTGRSSRPDGAGALRAPQTREAILPLLAETFREHGYEGASLSAISRRTGLGKGSLYHFFPGGKEEMAACVLTEIEAWFEARMFRPLREDPDPAAALRAMLAETDGYFRSGRRICLVGVFALSTTRDAFARRIDAYFAAWRDAVAAALARGGVAEARALDLAEETVTAIQGALVTASALQDPGLFERTLARLALRLAAALGEGATRLT